MSLWAVSLHHQSGRTWDTGRNAAQQPGEPGTDSEADACAHIPAPHVYRAGHSLLEGCGPHCGLSLMPSPFPLPLPPVEPGKAVCLLLRGPCNPALATGPTLFNEAKWKMSVGLFYLSRTWLLKLRFWLPNLMDRPPPPFCKGYFESHSQAMASWPSVASVLPQKLWLPWFRGEMSH